MTHQELYRSKLTTPEQALSHIRSGDVVVPGTYTGEPVLLMRNLHRIAPRVRDVKVWTSPLLEDYPFFADGAYADSFTQLSFFYGRHHRALHPTGRVSYMPLNMDWMGTGIVERERPRVFLCNAAPMDENGYLCLNPALQIEQEIFDAAECLILEVNPNLPRAGGAIRVHISKVTALVESDLPIFEAPTPTVGDTERQIAEFASPLIRDGDTIQIGLGNASNAVAETLTNKHDLGIHTELLSASLGKLMACGAVNNSRKNLNPGKAVCGFTWGDRAFYDFLDGHPDVLLRSMYYVANPAVISQNDNMVSVNTAVQIDLTGQVCSESIGHRQYSGTGGALDFAMGAYRSKGGRGIIAITSTAKGGTVSRIQPFLDRGAQVSISRNVTDYIITEYGVAKLRGATIRERAKALIAIAHPDFRKDLEAQAKEFMLW